MDQAKRLKLAAVFFTIFWIAGMLWWSWPIPSRLHHPACRLREHRRLSVVPRHALGISADAPAQRRSWRRPGGDLRS